MNRASRTSALFYALMLFGVAVAVLLAGGPAEGSSGIFLVTIGAGLLFFPPQTSVGGKTWLLAGVFLLCCALSLLQIGSLTGQPWKAAFSGLPVNLGKAVTPTPRETLFWWGVSAVSLGFILFCLSQPLRSRALLVLSTAGATFCGVYAGLAIFSLKTGWRYPFDPEPTFGFLPNRNHSAALLETGSMLALGVLGVVWKEKHWLAGLLAAAALAVCSTALMVYSASRGGVVFLVTGMLLWLFGLGRDRWSKPIFISFVAILSGGLILFFVSKGEARNRLVKQFGMHQELRGSADDAAVPASAEGDQEVTLDGRILIFKDTWRMILDAPLTGVGLGAYRYVYPQYRAASLAESTSAHPESDWMMLAAEAGLPAALAGVALTLNLLWRCRGQRSHAYWPLRWGVLCSALVMLGHGMVDVPMHRVALGWWIALFAAAGLQVWPTQESRVRPAERVIFWLTGLLALGIGSWMVRAEWYGADSTPPFAARKSSERILQLFHAGQVDEASNVASVAILKSPMEHELYLEKGILELNFTETEKEVERFFAAERALNPDWPKVPIKQGLAWINIDAGRTAGLWQDAMERKRRIERAQGRSGEALLPFFANLLSQSAGHPDLQHQLLAANRTDAKMVLIWLEQAEKAVVAEEIPKLAADDAFVAALSAPDRQRFLRAWYEKGDQPAFFAFLEAHPDWKDSGWPFQIRHLVEARQYQEAVAAVVERHRVEMSLETLLAAQPKDLNGESGQLVEDFAFYYRRGNEITARRLLREALASPAAATSPARKISPDAWRLAAILAAREGHWDAAWEPLRRYLRESGVDASL